MSMNLVFNQQVLN